MNKSVLSHVPATTCNLEAALFREAIWCVTIY